MPPLRLMPFELPEGSAGIVCSPAKSTHVGTQIQTPVVRHLHRWRTIIGAVGRCMPERAGTCVMSSGGEQWRKQSSRVGSEDPNE